MTAAAQSTTDLVVYLNAQLDYDDAELINQRALDGLDADTADQAERQLAGRRLLLRALAELNRPHLLALFAAAHGYDQRPAYRDEWRAG